MPACAINRPRKAFSLQVAIALLLLSTLASAQSLTGTVKNSTTGRPAAGDEVILLSLGQGMEEAGRTKSDAKGNFSFKLDSQGPHLIRVIHQEVTYHRMVPPGTTSVEVAVYDVGKKVEGISVVADIMRFQATQGQLQVERTFAVLNNSKPPRTQMNEHNLEFYVPDGATINEGQAMTAGGQPVNSAPVPEGANAKNRYAFLFPLRPGETRFSVVYSVPYTGSINIDAKSVYPLEHFVAIAPKAMQFAAAPGTNFTVAPYPGQPDANVEVASNLALGQPMAFKLSGEGMLASQAEEGEQQPSQGQGQGQASAAQPESRPGGGLGPPIDAPPPTQKYQWYILGGLALALVVGGVYVASRQQAANRDARAKGKGFPALESEDDYELAEVAVAHESRAVSARPQPASARGASPSMLLEALKEELFQLEVEHTQGKITREEYLQAKAALDQTLQRALKREAQKA
ncbi:MAG TPA: carboxypeptidase regulatory-like domain-containing protein [Candidatus Sulfotelmatobacter sp.]